MSPSSWTPALRLAGLILVADALVLIWFGWSVAMLQAFTVPGNPGAQGWILAVALVGSGLAAAVAGIRALRGRTHRRATGIGVALALGALALLTLATGAADTPVELAVLLGLVAGQAVVVAVLVRAPAGRADDGRDVRPERA